MARYSKPDHGSDVTLTPLALPSYACAEPAARFNAADAWGLAYNLTHAGSPVKGALKQKMVHAVCDDAESLRQIIARPNLIGRHEARNLAVPFGGRHDGIDRSQIVRIFELAVCP